MTSLSLRDWRDPTVPANENRRGQPWTEEEDRVLLVKGPVYGYGAIAQRLGRTAGAGNQRHLYLKNRKDSL